MHDECWVVAIICTYVTMQLVSNMSEHKTLILLCLWLYYMHEIGLVYNTVIVVAINCLDSVYIYMMILCYELHLCNS